MTQPNILFIILDCLRADRQPALAAAAPSAPGPEAETSEEVVNRLRSLGYID